MEGTVQLLVTVKKCDPSNNLRVRVSTKEEGESQSQSQELTWEILEGETAGSESRNHPGPSKRMTVSVDPEQTKRPCLQSTVTRTRSEEAIAEPEATEKLIDPDYVPRFPQIESSLFREVPAQDIDTLKKLISAEAERITGVPLKDHTSADFEVLRNYLRTNPVELEPGKILTTFKLRGQTKINVRINRKKQNGNEYQNNHLVCERPGCLNFSTTFHEDTYTYCYCHHEVQKFLVLDTWDKVNISHRHTNVGRFTHDKDAGTRANPTLQRRIDNYSAVICNKAIGNGKLTFSVPNVFEDEDLARQYACSFQTFRFIQYFSGISQWKTMTVAATVNLAKIDIGNLLRLLTDGGIAVKWTKQNTPEPLPSFIETYTGPREGFALIYVEVDEDNKDGLYVGAKHSTITKTDRGSEKNTVSEYNASRGVIMKKKKLYLVPKTHKSKVENSFIFVAYLSSICGVSNVWTNSRFHLINKRFECSEFGPLDLPLVNALGVKHFGGTFSF